MTTATSVFTSDTPRFAERGVTLSASTVSYSEEWMHCLIDTMAALRMNSLLWEVKISRGCEEAEESGRSEDGFFATSEPYVSPEQARETIAYARERGIAVIPEINSPGHMRTWLKHYPQYAIPMASGELDLERLDASNPEAVQWYLDLVDSYADVFDSDWWHMGADEFENELDHRTYADYPHLARIAQEQWGEKAKPWDVNTAFVNKVNAHLKKQGKHLRIWNDGIRRDGVVSLDSDILVEYWVDRAEQSYSPAELAQMGHKLLNVPQYLYFSRSEKHIYNPSAQEIYEGKRCTLELFDGDQSLTVTAESNGQKPHVNLSNVGTVENTEAAYQQAAARVEESTSYQHMNHGVRLSLWPDRDWFQTPGDVMREARDLMILVGHIAWDGNPPFSSWAEFKEYADSLELPVIPEY